MANDTRIPDLNPDNSQTGRYLAVKPDGSLVGVPDGNALKPGWRWASAGDVTRKQEEEAARKQAENPQSKPAAKSDAK